MIELPESLQDGAALLFTEPGHDHLWQELMEKDPLEVAAKAGARCLGGPNYLVNLLGAPYFFGAAERRIIAPADRRPPDKRTALSLLHYFNGAGPGGLSGRLVPETVLPGGERFFSGTHALPRQAILDAFGERGVDFQERGFRLGAEIVEAASGSYAFSLFLLPKIFVQVTLCEKDEEFPAELYFAFDSSAADHVPLSILSALVGILNQELTNFEGKS